MYQNVIPKFLLPEQLSAVPPFSMFIPPGTNMNAATMDVYILVSFFAADGGDKNMIVIEEALKQNQICSVSFMIFITPIYSNSFCCAILSISIILAPNICSL